MVYYVNKGSGEVGVDAQQRTNRPTLAAWEMRMSCVKSRRKAAVAYIWAILLFAAVPAAAQVKIDVRLEKQQYLEGEPVFVVVDIKNVGVEPVGYLKCNNNVQLSVPGVEPRKNPNIFGCFSGFGFGGMSVCGASPSPMLLPEQTATSKHLLKGYDLKTGQYLLAASGRIGVALPGAQLDHELSLTVTPARKGELQKSFDPLISDAVFDPSKFDLKGSRELRARLLELRAYARDAIIESAAPFLEPLIMRFVEEGNDSAILALGHIASESGRAYLKELYRVSDERRRSLIMLALALTGHKGDAVFFVEALKDETIDSKPNSLGMSIKQYAALGLGHIGGDHAVRYLESAFAAASSPEVRNYIVTALGNTQSRLAVSILLGIYSHEGYGALITLTHYEWDLDMYTPFTNRKSLLRWWEKNKYKFPIFGPDNCPVDPPARTFAGTYIPANKQQEANEASRAPKKEVGEISIAAGKRRAVIDESPRISAVIPDTSMIKSMISISGYNLVKNIDLFTVDVFFVQGDQKHKAQTGVSSSERRDFLNVIVPDGLSPGQWQITVAVGGRESAPVEITIIEQQEIELVGVVPPLTRPRQTISIGTKHPMQFTDYILLTDADGRQWRLNNAGMSLDSIYLKLPDEVADGEALVRVGREVNGREQISEPISFFVFSGPLPLDPSVVKNMTPVAAGQWTYLPDSDSEAGRADRIDFEFRQNDVVFVGEAAMPEVFVRDGRVQSDKNFRIRIPPRLKPGTIMVRTRTWLDNVVSEWSEPAAFSVLESPAQLLIWSIYLESTSLKPQIEGFINAQTGDTLLLYGHFPVKRVNDLRIQLKSTKKTLKIQALNTSGGGVIVEIPPQARPGEWELVIDAKDKKIRPQTVAIIRIEQQNPKNPGYRGF